MRVFKKIKNYFSLESINEKYEQPLLAATVYNGRTSLFYGLISLVLAIFTLGLFIALFVVS